MTRTGERAIAWAIRESIHPTRDYRGLCLQFVRHSLDVPARYPSARVAWQSLEPELRRRDRPPPGAPTWWEVGLHWHIALHLGSWVYLSTDVQRVGLVDAVPGALIRQRWGARWLGWSPELNGVPLSL